MATPQVSVVLNAMNGEKFIAEALRSVLGQTFKNFELIVIDDGSTDRTWEVIQSFTDARIRALKQENRGIAATANRGVGLARAAYVARIDQDDIMLPRRLERQFAFLEAHPDVALVCTYVQLIHGFALSNDMYRAPLSSTALALRLVFECPIVQPSVMFRIQTFRDLAGYDEDKRIHGADDFDLWTRMAQHHKLICLPEALTHYRLHGNNFSTAVKTADHNILISGRSLHRYLGTDYTLQECQALAGIFHRGKSQLPKLKRGRALNMFDRVSEIIAGPPENWDVETWQVYNLQRRMIFFHHILRHAFFRPFIQQIPALRLR